MAIITTTEHQEKVQEGAGVPVFIAEDMNEMKKISLVMSRIFKGMIHDLDNGVWLIFRH